jgi:hypothetical protein
MAIYSSPLGLAVWVIGVRVGHAQEEKLFTLPGAIHSTLSDRPPTVLLYGPLGSGLWTTSHAGRPRVIWIGRGYRKP